MATTLYQIQTDQLCSQEVLYWNGAVWTYRLDDAEAYDTRKSAQMILTELAKRGQASFLAYVQPFTAIEVTR